MRAMPSNQRTERGFTLIEILTVVLIIGILAAVAIPNVITYLRVYQTRSAAQEVAGEITRARLQAITRNTNLGVLFVIRSSTTYQVVFEDDQDPLTGTPRNPSTRASVDTLLTQPGQVGVLRTLPFPVEFDTTGATSVAMRFNHLGAWCNPTGTAEPCPAVTVTGATPAILSSTKVSRITVRNPRTNMTAQIEVNPGGRPRVL